MQWSYGGVNMWWKLLLVMLKRLHVLESVFRRAAEYICVLTGGVGAVTLYISTFYLPVSDTPVKRETLITNTFKLTGLPLTDFNTNFN